MKPAPPVTKTFTMAIVSAGRCRCLRTAGTTAPANPCRWYDHGMRIIYLLAGIAAGYGVAYLVARRRGLPGAVAPMNPTYVGPNGQLAGRLPSGILLTGPTGGTGGQGQVAPSSSQPFPAPYRDVSQDITLENLGLQGYWRDY